MITVCGRENEQGAVIIEQVDAKNERLAGQKNSNPDPDPDPCSSRALIVVKVIHFK